MHEFRVSIRLGKMACKVSWGTRRLKVYMHETMIIMGGIIATIGIYKRHGNYDEGLRFNPNLTF